MSLAAANRDPHAHSQPDVSDIRRKDIRHRAQLPFIAEAVGQSRKTDRRFANYLGWRFFLISSLSLRMSSSVRRVFGGCGFGGCGGTGRSFATAVL